MPVAANEVGVASGTGNGPMIADENDRLPQDDAVQVENEAVIVGKINLGGEVARGVLLQHETSGRERNGRRHGMRAGRGDLRGRGRLLRNVIQRVRLL